MNLKNFNILNIVGNMLPNSLRTSTIIGYVSNLLTPLKTTHSEIYDEFYDIEKDKAERSSLVPLYEKVLNTEFGLSYSIGVTNSIYISHQRESLEGLYLYEEAEAEDVYLFQEGEEEVFLYTEEEYEAEFDYEVNVDSTENINQNRLVNLLDKINLWGKRYLIKNY